MNINVIAVGKIKESYLKEGIRDYQKRLKPYVNLTIREIPDLAAGDNLSDKDLENIKIKEGEKILEALGENTYTIGLDIQGKMLDSVELAQKVENLTIDGYSDISLIIGGSNGLSNEVLSSVDFRLSFSKMTFAHQMVRLILLEQVYRAFRIINNHPYHK